MIHEEDFIQSIADALQWISYTHPSDFIHAMHQAYLREPSPAAQDAMAQILANSRLSALRQRPICQDTGIVVAFLKIGMHVHWQTKQSLQAMVDEGVHRAYGSPTNVLRASILAEPAHSRRNTGDNTPAVVHVEMVAGDTVEVKIAAKGGGSENKSRFTVLNPSDSVEDWVVNTVAGLGAGWCPPGIVGIGMGGTAEKAMLLAKESLLAPVDLADLQQRGATTELEAMRLRLADRINALGIGAQGLGGVTTVLDVKILEYPTHAASLPVALCCNCAATRHAHFVLDGSGPAHFPPSASAPMPQVDWRPDPNSRRVNLDTLTPEQAWQWRAGEHLLLSGKLITARDAAHRRLAEALQNRRSLPQGVDLTNRLIYYVGPVDPVAGEVIGPAGPTTATRMDKFTEVLFAHTGVLGMIGKAERGPAALESLRAYRGVYLVAVGGAAGLVSQTVRACRVLAWPDLGMEAIHEFVVQDMPVTVAVDSQGNNLHVQGPLAWQHRAES